MKLRALCLTLLASAGFAPAANASVADTILPFYDAADGVRVVHRSSGDDAIRFDAKAAKIYKTIVGKRAEIGCGAASVPSDLGDPLQSTGFGVSTSGRIAKRRGSISLGRSKDIQFCSISTKKSSADTLCLPPELGSKLCVRVAVAVKPEGAASAGKLGYWTDTKNLAVVVLLADGTRKFVRIQDGVFSTNDLSLTGLDSDAVFTLT